MYWPDNPPVCTVSHLTHLWCTHAQNPSSQLLGWKSTVTRSPYSVTMWLGGCVYWDSCCNHKVSAHRTQHKAQCELEYKPCYAWDASPVSLVPCVHLGTSARCGERGCWALKLSTQQLRRGVLGMCASEMGEMWHCTNWWVVWSIHAANIHPVLCAACVVRMEGNQIIWMQQYV
jgi:hypothetical protein